MLQKIKSLSSKRSVWLLLIITITAFLATALYFQHVMNIQPCIKCVYIRAAFSAMLFAALIGFITAKITILRSLALIGVIAAAVFGLNQANELLEIERVIAAGGFSTCAFFAEYPSWLPLEQWLPAVFEPTASCGDDSWSLLDRSMAFWTSIILYSYIIVLTLFLLCQVVKVNSNPYKG
ncbi:disulfide bond formation protein DsbB [Rheinheimera salexigens]|uniref:Disulfide bond formation protein B n=1 Tax=Rheinheimera salexigens TaxID=1628148 RepID=A0A1E7Q7A6_9GAMM|nr:disulfide bond formation protein DsbB [Rheinheimera salexigens]OEY69928.1 disulfide bond formation protein DsbB [Rheinheimera salexigens]